MNNTYCVAFDDFIFFRKTTVKDGDHLPLFSLAYLKFFKMSEYRKLTHVYCKSDYHIVFTTKYRFQILEVMVKSLVKHDLQVISIWKDVQIQEMNVQKDHVHLVCLTPPKV